MRSIITTLVCSLVFAVMPAIGQETHSADQPWMDFEHCDMCKNVSSQEGLREALKCEMHKIDNGMLMVAFIPAEMKDAMRHAAEGMDATVAKLEAGKKVMLCSFCQSIGKALGAGAKMQKINGEMSNITILTAEDPAVVKQIHDMADRTIEFAKSAKTVKK